MRNNKKQTGGELYDDYHQANKRKQYYFNDIRDQEFNSFSKNKAFDPDNNPNEKGKFRKHDSKFNYNNKKDNVINYEKKTNDYDCNYKLLRNSQFNNKLNNTITYNENYICDNQQHKNKNFKNYQTNQGCQVNEFNLNQFNNRGQNKNNQFKNYQNKKFQIKDFNDNSYQDKILRDTKFLENPEFVNKLKKPIIQSTDELIIKNMKEDLSILSNNNFQIQKEENSKNLIFKDFNDTKIIQHKEIDQMDYLRKNSHQVDSLKSIEDNITFKNSVQNTFNEKNYIEDNTKTNTNSNTPVNISPITAYHKKSINSIKNEIKLDDSKDYNEKINNNKEEKFNEIDEIKQEIIENTKEINKSNFMDVNEMINLSKLHYQLNQNNYDSRQKMKNRVILDEFRYNDNYKLEQINSKNNINSYRKNNLENDYKNKFSENIKLSTNSYDKTNQSSNFNLNSYPNSVNNNFKNMHINFNHILTNNLYHIYPNINGNTYIPSNFNLFNGHLFQPPSLVNINPDFNPSFHSYNKSIQPNIFRDTNNFSQNPNFLQNNNSFLIANNHQNMLNMFQNNTKNILTINSQRNIPCQNLNLSINSTNNFFIDNLNRPINQIESQIQNKNFSSSLESFNNLNSPQKIIFQNESFEQNKKSTTLNSYFNYMFNDLVTNKDSLIPKGKEIEITPLGNSKEKVSLLKEHNIDDNNFRINNISVNKSYTTFQDKSNIFIKKGAQLEASINIDKTFSDRNCIKENIKKDTSKVEKPNSFQGSSLNEQNSEKKKKIQNILNEKRIEKKEIIVNEDKITNVKSSNHNFNDNVEILKVVLMNVPGNESNKNNLTFTIHKFDNLFETFKSFLTMNKISLIFEFPILVNIFQAITTIYNLNNSIISKSDEKSIKILHNIWKNHCFLVSQKTLFNKKNDDSAIKKNIENDLNKILNLDIDNDIYTNELNNEKIGPEKNLIKKFGVHDSSFSYRNSFEFIEENSELNKYRSSSSKGEFEYLNKEKHNNCISLFNNSF